MKIIEVAAKDLEYYTHLVEKTVAGFERTDSNLKFYCGENAIKQHCMLQRNPS